MRLPGLAAALALCLVTDPAPAAGSDPVQLTPGQMRVAASDSLAVGAPQQALALADALLARDAQDLPALLIRARALRDLGQTDAAKTAARQAWDLAEEDPDQFASAMVMAQVLSTAGQKTRAQLWLRRAVEIAPHENLEAMAIRDFKYVRATNPWSSRFSFSITPDSNINNGSAYRTSFLNYELTEALFGQPVQYQLTGAAVALSGIEFELGADTRYRFWQTATRAQDLYLSLDYRHFELTGDAKSEAPGVKGSDFDFASVFAGYGYRAFNFGEDGEFAFRADAGQSWYGYEQFARYLRASALQSYALTGTTRINGRIAGEWQYGINTADVNTYSAETWAAHFFPNGRQLRVVLSGAVTDSPVASEEYVEAGLGASLVLGEIFDGAGLQMGLDYRGRDYDVSPHSPDGRQDHRVSASATVIFTGLDYFGFNPTMTVYAQNTESNIALYEARRFGINFGIQSAF